MGNSENNHQTVCICVIQRGQARRKNVQAYASRLQHSMNLAQYEVIICDMFKDRCGENKVKDIVPFRDSRSNLRVRKAESAKITFGPQFEAVFLVKSEGEKSLIPESIRMPPAAASKIEDSVLSGKGKAIVFQNGGVTASPSSGFHASRQSAWNRRDPR